VAECRAYNVKSDCVFSYLCVLKGLVQEGGIFVIATLIPCRILYLVCIIRWFLWRTCLYRLVNVKWSSCRPGVAQRVGRGIALLFHDSGTRRGWVVSSTTGPHFTPGKDQVPISQEVGWAPGPVWTGGKSRPHRDSIPERLIGWYFLLIYVIRLRSFIDSRDSFSLWFRR